MYKGILASETLPEWLQRQLRSYRRQTQGQRTTLPPALLVSQRGRVFVAEGGLLTPLTRPSPPAKPSPGRNCISGTPEAGAPSPPRSGTTRRALPQAGRPPPPRGGDRRGPADETPQPFPGGPADPAGRGLLRGPARRRRRPSEGWRAGFRPGGDPGAAPPAGGRGCEDEAGAAPCPRPAISGAEGQKGAGCPPAKGGVGVSR